jgi:hypothetical protein
LRREKEKDSAFQEDLDMDTTVRLNLIAILLVGIICGFIVKEIAGKQPQADTAGQRQYDLNRSLVEKVLSLNAAPQPPVQSPQASQPNQPALPVPFTEDDPVPLESRLFVPKEQDIEDTASGKMKHGRPFAPPEGFSEATTNNYFIYREELPISAELKKFLDDIHGNFVLDVIPFSVFADFKRILLMMFRNKDSYMQRTLMPGWSAATTDLDKQAVYIMESKTFKGTFVHELSHIYYDGFFKPVYAPLWLSEGFAVRMQSAAQTDKENYWLSKEGDNFRNGKYINFNEFINADDLGRYDKSKALTWYAQSYSVVDYLLKRKTRDEFYQFSKNIKQGMPLERSLYRAYGMPFNTLNALEYAWQADLQKEQSAAAQGDKRK